MQSLYRIAIPRFLESPALSKHRGELQTLHAGTDDAAKQEAMDLFAKAATLNNLNRAADALSLWDELLLRFGESTHPTLLEPVATALFNKGVTLRRMDRPEDALCAYDGVVPIDSGRART